MGVFKTQIDGIHKNYAELCPANAEFTPQLEKCSFSGWQTWDTPDDFMKVLSPPTWQLQAFCIKLRETLHKEYKTKFGFHNLTSDKEGYYQSANIIDNLCEDPQAAVMFERSFANLGKKCDPTKITISLCGAGSSKVHVNKYILSQSVGKKALAPPPPARAAPAEMSFQLFSKCEVLDGKYTKSKFEGKTWTVFIDGTVKAPNCKSEDGMLLVEEVSCRMGRQVTIKLKSNSRCRAQEQTHYISVKKSAKEELIKFLNYITLSAKRKAGLDKQIEIVVTKLSSKRRRMAQREYSSRRDSPVMVRLLEEITEASRKHNELN